MALTNRITPARPYTDSPTKFRYLYASSIMSSRLAHCLTVFSYQFCSRSRYSALSYNAVFQPDKKIQHFSVKTGAWYYLLNDQMFLLLGICDPLCVISFLGRRLSTHFFVFDLAEKFSVATSHHIIPPSNRKCCWSCILTLCHSFLLTYSI